MTAPSGVDVGVAGLNDWPVLVQSFGWQDRMFFSTLKLRSTSVRILSEWAFVPRSSRPLANIRRMFGFPDRIE
jgi:hypothetical protein